MEPAPKTNDQRYLELFIDCDDDYFPEPITLHSDDSQFYRYRPQPTGKIKEGLNPRLERPASALTIEEFSKKHKLDGAVRSVSGKMVPNLRFLRLQAEQARQPPVVATDLEQVPETSSESSSSQSSSDSTGEKVTEKGPRGVYQEIWQHELDKELADYWAAGK